MLKLSWPRIEIGAEIEASAEDVWDLITNTERWPEWGPFISGVRCSENRLRIGLSGQILILSFLWLSFEITALEAGTSWTWRVAGIPATGHRIEDIDRNRCRLIFTLSWLAIKYIPFCKQALKRIKTILEPPG